MNFYGFAFIGIIIFFRVGHFVTEKDFKRQGEEEKINNREV